MLCSLLILLNVAGIFLKSDVYDKDDEEQSATTRGGKLTPLLDGSSDTTSSQV